MAFVVSGGDTVSPGGMYTPDPGLPLTSAAARTSASEVWRSQPAVRTVVDFIARSVAQIPLRAYRRVEDTDRQRLTDHPLSATLARPQDYVTPFRFWHGVLVDWLLHDRWCAAKLPGQDGQVRLQRIPAERYTLRGNVLDNVISVEVRDARGETQHLDPADVVFDHGYASGGVNGTSPMETLREVLDEQREAVKYRRQVWDNGARVPAVISRPADAPEWSPQARQRFREDMRGYLNDGAKAGGVPILEDGMELSKVDAFTPADARDIEGRQLSSVEVASAFHIPPELVGFRQGNYSNVREYRQQLYRDVLGPLISAVEQTINVQLVPDFADHAQVYAEFNVDAKLRASFEEQAQMMQSAVGAPWLTRNEARALQNRPSMDGGDALVTPLNVSLGGLASPRDTAGQRASGEAGYKNSPGDEAPSTVPDRPDTGAETTALSSELAGFFDRQSRAVLSRLGAKAKAAPPPLADAWSNQRWNDELATLLTARLIRLAAAGAWGVLDRYNPTSDGFAVDAMLGYLTTAAATHAAEINATTYDRLAMVMTDDEWRETAAAVFTARADDADNRAASLATEAVSFGSHDAARASGLARKRWVTASSEPRSEHQWINGETVPIDDLFSNGGRWPGDAQLPPWERVNCQCRLDYVAGEE